MPSDKSKTSTTSKQKRKADAFEFDGTPNKKPKVSVKKAKDPFEFNESDDVVVWKPAKKPVPPKGTPGYSLII